MASPSPPPSPSPFPGSDSSSSVSPAIIPFFYTALLLLPVILVIIRFYIRSRVKRHAFGFFHPFTNDGGGGERVLWCAVRAIQELDPLAQCFVYTGDVASPDSLSERAHNLFGVVLPRPVEVVRLSYRHLVEASLYPRFTLIGQSLGSMALALEAVLRRPPAVFVDTAGYAFSYPVVRLLLGGRAAAGGGGGKGEGKGGGSLVVCYTHYPTISGDMLQRVQQRTSMYNNDATVANR
ncbi:unnamed protein product [Closterium sp. NIES-54]